MNANNMQRRCCFCHKLLGFKKPLTNFNETSTFCLECMKTHLPELYKQTKHEKRINCIYEFCLKKDHCGLTEKAEKCLIHWEFLKIEITRERMLNELKNDMPK